MSDLHEHLATGTTTTCRCWELRRADGTIMGFTDHDRDLAFGGVVFRAGSGVTAKAISQTTGLSVDNTEAYGALSDAVITEADILAGRYDAASLRIWQVNWADVSARVLVFGGALGELRRTGGAFTAELRGIGEALGRGQGLIYHAQCAAVLGDGRCRFDLTAPGFSATAAILSLNGGAEFAFAGLAGYADRWFEKGRFEVLTGAGAGLWGVIRNDRRTDGGREITLWAGIVAALAAGDMVRLVAGCDKRAETCRVKFSNFLNFRGFPHIPGEDWLLSYPVQGSANDGGSRRA